MSKVFIAFRHTHTHTFVNPLYLLGSIHAEICLIPNVSQTHIYIRLIFLLMLLVSVWWWVVYQNLKLKLNLRLMHIAYFEILLLVFARVEGLRLITFLSA